ncbi:hypothetical protein Dimus_037072 [Dionaea muscipula]
MTRSGRCFNPDHLRTAERSRKGHCEVEKDLAPAVQHFYHLQVERCSIPNGRRRMQAGMAAKPVLGRRFSRKQESSHTFQASIDSTTGSSTDSSTAANQANPTAKRAQLKEMLISTAIAAATAVEIGESTQKTLLLQMLASTFRNRVLSSRRNDFTGPTTTMTCGFLMSFTHQTLTAEGHSDDMTIRGLKLKDLF